MASTSVEAVSVIAATAPSTAAKAVEELKQVPEHEIPAHSQVQTDTDDDSICSEADSTTSDSFTDEVIADSQPKQLQAGLFDDDLTSTRSCTPPHGVQKAPVPPVAPAAPVPPPVPAEVPCKASPDNKFDAAETLFCFDWDDTLLPSSWVQRQGLRLDAASTVTSAQREVLAEVAAVVGKTLRAARQHGTVVLVTNAERGWIELSCQKFLPTLAPLLENVKLVSARTAFEGSQCRSPLDWKLRAFDAEIKLFFGADVLLDQKQCKNVFSLGDSVHEREALLTATSSLPNCRSKSLKFVERPDYTQICKQHELINGCFEQLVHHDGNLDMCIRCP